MLANFILLDKSHAHNGAVWELPAGRRQRWAFDSIYLAGNPPFSWTWVQFQSLVCAQKVSSTDGNGFFCSAALWYIPDLSKKFRKDTCVSPALLQGLLSSTKQAFSMKHSCSSPCLHSAEFFCMLQNEGLWNCFSTEMLNTLLHTVLTPDWHTWVLLIHTLMLLCWNLIRNSLTLCRCSIFSRYF